MFQLNTKDDIAETVQRYLPGQDGTPDIGHAAFDMWEAIAQKQFLTGGATLTRREKNNKIPTVSFFKCKHTARS